MKRSFRGLFLGAVFLLFTSAFAPGATFVAHTVTDLTTDINLANTNGQDDVIQLDDSGSYILTARDNALNGLPAIAADGGHKLTITGSGTLIQRSTAGGTPTFRIFYVNSGGNLTLVGLILDNGSPGAFHGGAIYNDAETGNAQLTLIKCTFSNNSGDYGGAIFNDGYNFGPGPSTATLTVLNSTFLNNSAQHGGAIWNESGGIVMNVSNSTFNGNFTGNSTTGRSAGAIQFDASNGVATGSIVNCTFTHNSAVTDGGAVNVDGMSGNAQLTINNCTFDHNTAGNNGGGLAMDGSSGNATVTVSNCTFSGDFSNNLGDAIYLSETTSGTTVLQIGNSILASADPAGDYNITTDNLSGGTTTVTSNGYNLSDDATCGAPSGSCNDTGTGPGGLLNHAGDIRNTDPLLDPAVPNLKNNGGPTMTIALQATSPALDHGRRDTISTVANDQRGEFRPFDDTSVANGSGSDGSDIGAYEADSIVLSESRSGPNGTTLNLVFTTILGHNYEIQSRPSLTSSTWTTVTTSSPVPPFAGTGGVISVSVPNAIGSGTGFYRVHQL